METGHKHTYIIFMEYLSYGKKYKHGYGAKFFKFVSDKYEYNTVGM
jgi:hypothetical protein